VSHCYQEMQSSAEVWLGDVPSQWKSFRIKDVARLSPNFSNGMPQINELCSVIPMEKVSGKGEIISDDVEEYDLITSGLTSFEAGDVIFAKITPCMENGKGAYVKELPTNYAFGSTEFHVLRPRQMVDGKFIYYYTYNSVYRAYAEANMTGAAGQKRVSSRFLNYTRIFLTDIAVQVRIASYLDKTCAAVDKTIEAKQKQLEILDALRKSIIHKVVTRGLDDSVELKDSRIDFFKMVPIGWKLTKFRYEISIRNGDFISDKLDENGLHPVVGGNGFMGRTNAFNVDEDVVAIGRVGAYCGNVHLVTKKSWISDNALIVKSMQDLKYLVYVLIALDLNSEANKTAQPVITGTKIKNIRIAMPEKEEQSKIAYFLDGKLIELQHIKENIQQQISTLEQYRKSLIHECVTGKRRITEGDVQDQL